MSTLLALCHHRWSLPVLAEIGRTRGSRFATLTGRLGVAGESLRRTLGYLQQEGFVTRNEGYGHPLRPEYLLTAEGRVVAPRAAELLTALAGHEEVALKKWTLPVLAELTEPRRFSEIRAALPVTAGSLALALRDLENAELVRRTVTQDRPPQTRYDATDQKLVRVARAL